MTLGKCAARCWLRGLASRLKMLPALLLFHLTVCNGQWPLQNIGKTQDYPAPSPPHQPGYPYDDASTWTELQNPDLKLPEASQENATSKELHDNVLKIAANASDKVSIEDRVRRMVENQTSMRNDTDAYMNYIDGLYNNLRVEDVDDQDNSTNSYKYGMSVILRFLLEFYRIFRKMFSSESGRNQLPAIDMYGVSYDDALEVVKSKKNYSHLEMSVPVRRSADIFKSIIYESVEIIEMKCNATSPNWQCVVLYLANLISESINCPNVWYHAFVHLLTLENSFRVQNNFIYKIADVLKLTNMPFENVFDFVTEKIVEYKEDGRIHLTTDAILFTMIADLQENGLLDCISINYLYN